MQDLFGSSASEDLQCPLYFRQILVPFGLVTDFVYEDFTNL